MARSSSKTTGGNPKSPYKKVQKYKRAVLPGHVYIHNDSRLFIAPLNNLSAGGLFIDGITALPVGNHVRLVIKSPSLDRAFQAKGKIIRIEKDARRGLAVEFAGLESELKEFINNSVHKKTDEVSFEVTG